MDNDKAGPSKPRYMTVGDGVESASASALRATLNADIDRDSGYAGSEASEDRLAADLRRLVRDRAAREPLDMRDPTAGMEAEGGNELELETQRRAHASHIHQLYYNQNRSALGRQITRTVDCLRELQRLNATWPAQYPALQPRPSLTTTQSGLSRAGGSQVNLANSQRPEPPRRAATNLENTTSETTNEPERLLTAQAASEFSVLKLQMNVQGLSQTEITHSMKKESIASLLDGKISQSIRHLLLLRDRIEDTASKVLVTGDLNAGKSTFCNALLRKKVLPEDQQPCTSIFCEVLDARENGNLEEAHAVFKGVRYNRNDESTYAPFALSELDQVVVDNETYSSCKVYVKDTRTIDESLLNNGVVDISIIDAPGLNSDSLKTTAVFARQEEIDVVVFVVNAANHFTLSAKEFIWNAAHEKAYIFIVVNGFDNIRDKSRCERMILEQVAGLSPQTFKESSELVHFVSSNAIPVAPATGNPSPDGDDAGDPDKDNQNKSGKGKEREKIQDFEELEASLRRFVLEKRARSKLAPAKTYLLNVLADLHLLATVNRDVAQAELDRVARDLAELEPAFEQSKKARIEVSDQVDGQVEEDCKSIYAHTRESLSTAILGLAENDFGVVYPGLTGALQYAEDIKMAMLERIASVVNRCESTAKHDTIRSVNTIKQLGILHVGNEFDDLNFNSERMFRARRDALSRQVNFDIEYLDFFDFGQLWSRQEKYTGAGMALTVASLAGGRALGGFGWVDGALGAVKVLGTRNLRSMIIPGVLASVLLTAAYMLHAIPSTLAPRLSQRISEQLASIDYVHQNSQRISHEVRKILRHPADRLRDGLRRSEQELGQRRADSQKVKQESEVACKYFGNLLRDAAESRARTDDIDLEGPTPGFAGRYEPGPLR